MKQYLNLLTEIKEKGTYKPAAREGMPGTQSLFGYQFRHNLADGFPLLTTKKMFWKGVVIELLWFLRGDTNIKFLVDNGVNIWNEDAYQYYLKMHKKHTTQNQWQLDNNVKSDLELLSFEDFIKSIKEGNLLGFGRFNVSGEYEDLEEYNYTYGDCGFQYGKVWRNFGEDKYCIKEVIEGSPADIKYHKGKRMGIDQIKNVINSLKKSPESRRHIITAIDPAHDIDLALYWCHAMFQFNCRPLDIKERYKLYCKSIGCTYYDDIKYPKETMDQFNIPKYYLDCQLYQRSADVVLGVPFNIASYALLTEILAKICNMIPGEFIHTFGDVHIYDNHKEAVEEQLKRTPAELPKLKISDEGNDWAAISNLNFDMIEVLDYTDFTLENYNPQSAIKAELSTGLKK